MDQPSTIGNKKRFVLRPTVGSTEQNHNSRTIKSCKVATELDRHSQSVPHSQNQNLAQGVTSAQLTNDNPPASILGRTDQVLAVSPSTNIGTELDEMKERMKRAQVKQEALRRKLKTLEENTEAMMEHMRREATVREDIGERLNISKNFQTIVQDRQADVRNVLAGFRQRYEQVTKTDRHQRHKDLREQMDAEISKVKMNGDRLESKKKEVLMVAAEAEQLRTELMKVTATGDRVEMEQKECDVVLCSDQQRHSEEIKKIDDAVLNFEAEFDVVRENSMKLVSVIDEDSERKLKLMSKPDALRVSITERQEHIEDLKSRMRDSEGRQASMRTKIEELKSANLAIISDYRKRMEEMKAKDAATSKKLSDVNSINERLADCVTKSIDDVEKLGKISDGKDCELQKLRENLIDVLDSNKNLLIKARGLEKSVADSKEWIAREIANFETFITADQTDQFEIEMRVKLADLRLQCNDKENRTSNLHERLKAETLELSQRRAALDKDNVRLDQQLVEFQKSTEDCRRDIRKVDSELDMKLHESTQSSAQCLTAEHERQINEQTKNIDTLREEISAAEAEYEQDNKRRTEFTFIRREGHKAKLKEFKSEIADLEKKVSAARDYINKLSKEAPRAPRKAANFTPPATSSPVRAASGLWDDFGFGDSSDDSSISSLSVFEDARRRYEEYLEANKTDAA